MSGDNHETAILVAAIECEMEPMYLAGTSDFLMPCVVALTLGNVLVGRLQYAPGSMSAHPLIAAYPDGRVTIDGVSVVCDLTGRSMAPSLDAQRGKPWRSLLALPARSFFEPAFAFYALVGWQSASQIARRSEGCAECGGSGLVPVDGVGIGRGFEACGCVDVQSDWSSPRDEDDLAREEPGAWYTRRAA